MGLWPPGLGTAALMVVKVDVAGNAGSQLSQGGEAVAVEVLVLDTDQLLVDVPHVQVGDDRRMQIDPCEPLNDHVEDSSIGQLLDVRVDAKLVQCKTRVRAKALEIVEYVLSNMVRVTEKSVEGELHAL